MNVEVQQSVFMYSEVGKMKTGDYMIHVYLVAGKNFKCDDCDTVNPVITVETCGETKYSQAKSDIPCGSDTQTVWKEHLFFEPRNRHESVIEQDTIIIKVMNKGMFRDEMIGMYEFDMTFVYFKEKHAFHNQWIALFNPESEDFSAVSGNLKLSIAVQGPGDEQVQLNDETGPENPDQQTLMPAQIKKEFKQLKIRFINAEKLPNMDTFGSIDAYIITKFGGKEMKTTAVTAKSDVAAIEQEWWLPIAWPLSSDRLVIKCYDEDKVVDEIVGSMYFSVKELVSKGQQPGGYFYWQNLYGAPKGFSGNNVDLMNENPELASDWMGRILMHIECEDSKHPERKQQTLDDSIKQYAIDHGYFTPKEYEIIADVGLGICLPGDEKYKVKIKIGDFSIETSKPKEAKSGYNRWSERFNTTTFKSVYPSLEQMDRIYVYLMDGSKPICFWKGKVTEFANPDPEGYRWLVMKNDKAIGKVDNDYEAGLIQVKISINEKHSKGPCDYKNFEAWKRPPPRRLMSKKVRCFIFQCKDIPSADEDGASDAFISVWNQEGKDYETKVIEDSLNPIYFETIELLYDMPDLENAPPIVFNVWDSDPGIIDSKDYLGRAVIYLNQCSSNLNSEYEGMEEDQVNNEVPKPRWEPIRMGFDESQPPCGYVLCSFIIARDDFEFKTPSKYLDLSATVPCKPYSVEINVLGLRQLESFGLMPIKKPFIKFRIKSLLPPDKAQAVTNVQTDPNAPGPNPNINTTITFNVQLPVEQLYCPSLACDAFDYVYMIGSQPLIGTFSLPIGELKGAQEEKREQDIKDCREIIDFLNEHLGQSAEMIKKKASLRATENLSTSAQKKLAKGIKQKVGKTKQKLQDEQLIPSDRADGYGQLIDEGDEETKELIGHQEDDDAASSKFDESSKVKSEQEALNKIETQLQQFLQAHLDSNKISPQDQKIKASLNKRLLEQKEKLKEEQKKAAKVKAELDKHMMKESGGGVDNILCPKYQFNEDLKIWKEVDIPPETMYMAVGYNDLPRVKMMMEGDDQEKRTGAKKGKASRATRARMTTGTAARDKLEQELAEAEELDRKLEITNKHYRKFYDDELENNKDLFPNPPFLRYEIKRGQSRGLKKSMFDIFGSEKQDESGQVTNEKVVGFFKGRIKVSNDEEEEAYKKEKAECMTQIMDLIKNVHQKTFKMPLDIELCDLQSAEAQQKFLNKLETMAIDDPRLIEFFKDQASEEMIRRQLLTQTQAAIQFYVLECFDLASRDIGSFSDPYMVVKCGKSVIDNRDEAQMDEPNPKINKVYTFNGTFPGAPTLEIEAWDYDDLFGDDLIGATYIDLDDRLFSSDWQAIEEKPIEYRQLYHESTSLSQGVVICWLEIEPQSKGKKVEKEQKIWDIAPEPQLDYEVRVSVMDTKDVPCEDAEGTSDVFIKAYINDDDKKTTDTHYRCKNGEASFNYRILFNIKAPDPKGSYLLVLQAWDFDLFTKNDYICEWTLDLKPLFDSIRLSQTPIMLTKNYYNAYLKPQMPPGTHLEFRDDDTFFLGTMKDGKLIKIRLDLRIMPGVQAKATPVGSARTEPNMEPYLPAPVGRIQFSLNPFSMLSQLMGKEFMAKFLGVFMVVACCALCIMMLPMIFSNLISQLITSVLTGGN